LAGVFGGAAGGGKGTPIKTETMAGMNSPLNYEWKIEDLHSRIYSVLLRIGNPNKKVAWNTIPHRRGASLFPNKQL